MRARVQHIPGFCDELCFGFVLLITVLLRETMCSTDFMENTSDKVDGIENQLLATGANIYSSAPSPTQNTGSTPPSLGPVSKRLAFLDKMLVRYDKRAWPTYGSGQPTEVSINMYVNSLGSINAANMEFGMDMYLRQAWLDPRLSATKYGINHSVTLNGQDLIEQIWKPDLFFRNLKSANFHMVTVPNKLIRLEPDGHVLFSMRLTLRLSCVMSFRQYPLDTQRCWVVIGPYAQTTDQVVIKWQDPKPIMIEQELEVPEFDMTFQPPGSFMRAIDTGNFSFLNVSFILVRQNGYHLVQTYLPTFLIVMISWVSFWLNVDATPARVTLGVTTLLTLTTVSSGIRTQLPPVSYVKAIDVWIGACSVMVFGALLEFTLVNYLSRRKVRSMQQKKSLNIFGRYVRTPITSVKNIKEKEQIEMESDSATKSPTVSEKQINVKMASMVDRTCRVLFPVAFFIFNVAYWTYYLHIS